MGKKKPTKSLAISPKIPISQRAVRIDSLKQGDFFLFGAHLHILTDNDPVALIISETIEGTVTFDDEDMVIPVNVEIKWSYK